MPSSGLALKKPSSGRSCKNSPQSRSAGGWSRRSALAFCFFATYQSCETSQTGTQQSQGSRLRCNGMSPVENPRFRVRSDVADDLPVGIHHQTVEDSSLTDAASRDRHGNAANEPHIGITKLDVIGGEAQRTAIQVPFLPELCVSERCLNVPNRPGDRIRNSVTRQFHRGGSWAEAKLSSTAEHGYVSRCK
jgi:hypothetical protein